MLAGVGRARASGGTHRERTPPPADALAKRPHPAAHAPAAVRPSARARLALPGASDPLGVQVGGDGCRGGARPGRARGEAAQRRHSRSRSLPTLAGTPSTTTRPPTMPPKAKTAAKAKAPKAKKDPNAPKKPCGSYIFFW